MYKKRDPIPMSEGEYFKKNTTDAVFSLKDAMDIGKAHMIFRRLDKNKKSTASIDIYMDAGKFMTLCELLRSGEMVRRCERTNANILFSSWGGSTGGETRAKRFTVERSNRPASLIFKAQEGKGKKTKTNGIVFSEKADTYIIVPIVYTPTPQLRRNSEGDIFSDQDLMLRENDEMLEFALMGQMMVRSYSDYIMRLRRSGNYDPCNLPKAGFRKQPSARPAQKSSENQYDLGIEEIDEQYSFI